MPEVVDVKAMTDDEFVKKYKKLAYNFVWRKYGSNLESIKSNTGLEIEDLIQCGMIGLLKAREDFNPAYGCEFSTLAIPKMHGETTRAIIDNQKVKIAREIFYLKGRIIRRKLTEEKPEVISQQLGVSVEDVEEALQYQQIPSSLSEVMYSSGGEKAEITLESKLVDESSIRKTEEIEKKIVMRSFINTLPDRELMIWDMYSNHMSQGNIGKRVGVTQTQISRILKQINQRAVAFGKAQGVAK
ncbi:sigma-70 family RNA polymerase sigma factor [Bacillus pretiosus]|uniref:Sigma-70 family RNA polymerase sigma factor n=1 Tax=Bacillus pretiosus TaxID=2983392 RepID=A0ABT3EQZ4_9BACI|nr:sigma-70 family RNA polymerase sigma factor [Bacillus pretiosus]MCW1239247.1 sigma-70 family RNA polymerase sigma factor [Bacillus pretiosus]